jgi:hypothetical protein
MFLVLTGEESTARAKYEDAEPHRTASSRRVIHQWRPMLDWKEEQFWDIIEPGASDLIRPISSDGTHQLPRVHLW